MGASPHNTGMALMASGKYEEAGLAFEQALEHDPDAADTWSALGVCMSKLEQPEAALVCQKQVLRIRASADHAGAQRAREQEFSELASSATLPALPGGGALTLATGSLSDCDTGGRLWSSAHVLCRWQKGAAEQIAGSEVLELGCGTGGVGLFAAGLGARRVVLTDGGPDAVLELARANAGTNEHMWGGETRVEVLPYAWGEPLAQPIVPEAGGHRFKWVFGSDVTYSAGAHALLCATIKQLLSQQHGAADGCRVVLAHEHRVTSPDVPDEKFSSLVAEAERAGLGVTKLLTEMEGERQISLLECTLQ